MSASLNNSKINIFLFKQQPQSPVLAKKVTLGRMKKSIVGKGKINIEFESIFSHFSCYS